MARELIKVLKNKKFENLIINGDHQIWQRGNFNNSVTDQYVADRWKSRKTVGNAEISQQFDGVDPYLRALSNTADSSLLQVGQQIEYRFFKPLLGKTVKFKFEAAGLNGNAASLTNSVTVFFRNDVEDGGVVWGSSATSNVTVVANLSGTSFETITGEFTIPADTKAMFIQYGAPSNQAYGIGDGFSIKNFMIYDADYGDVEFDTDRNYQEELELCQRYYEKSYDINTAPGTATNNGIMYETGSAFTIRYKQRKRIFNPTVVGYSPNSGASGNGYDFTGAVDRVFNGAVTGDTGFGFLLNGMPSSSIGGTHWTADAEF